MAVGENTDSKLLSWTPKEFDPKPLKGLLRKRIRPPAETLHLASALRPCYRWLQTRFSCRRYKVKGVKTPVFTPSDHLHI